MNNQVPLKIKEEIVSKDKEIEQIKERLKRLIKYNEELNKEYEHANTQKLELE